MDLKEKIKELKEKCFTCKGCNIDGLECRICSTDCEVGHRHVFGVGNIKASIMFAGQNPGSEEVKSRKPFVGRSGQILDRIIHALGFTRSQVYITNVCKGYTDENRTPGISECRVCGSLFLENEIELIQPKILVAVGAPTLSFLIPSSESITRAAGKVLEGSLHKIIVPMPHPAAYLRNRSMYKPLISQSISKIKSLLRQKS